MLSLGGLGMSAVAPWLEKENLVAPGGFLKRDHEHPWKNKMSNEKTWLFRLYRGLYYPVIWGLFI